MSDLVHAGASAAEGLHDVVWVRGPDTVRFLDGLISQDIANLGDGHVAHSFLLAPNGKLRVPHVLWRGSEEVGLISSAGTGAIAAADLSRFKIRVDAEIEVDERPIVTVIGADASSVVAATGADVADNASWSSHPVIAGAVPFPRGGPDRFVVVGLDLDAIVAAGATRAPAAAFEALRIELGEPLIGRDVGDSTIPQEMGTVDHAVSFTKGCYLGQELVARIDSRGHVNRHLRGLVITSGETPSTGAEVVDGDKVVGELTSVAESERLGGPVGLALVRREIEPGGEVTLRWDGGAARATVRELPLV